MEGTKVITIIGAIASAVVGVVSVIIGLNANNTQQPVPVQQPSVVYTTPVYQQPIYQQPVQPVCVSTGTGYTNQYQQPQTAVYTDTGYTNQYQQPAYQQPVYQQPAYQPQQPQIVYDGISDPNYGVGEGIFGCSAIPAYCNYQTNPTVSIPSYQPPPAPPVQQPTQPVSDNYYGNARPSSPQQPLAPSESRESILSEDYTPGMYERFKTLFESVQNDLPLIKEMEEKQKIREGNYRDTVYSAEGWGK